MHHGPFGSASQGVAGQPEKVEAQVGIEGSVHVVAHLHAGSAFAAAPTTNIAIVNIISAARHEATNRVCFESARGENRFHHCNLSTEFISYTRYSKLATSSLIRSPNPHFGL